MISVNVSFIGKDLKSLTVSGHANFDKYGKDIVCAGVSAVVTGGINALESEIENIKIINDYSMYKEVNNYKLEANKILDDKQIASIELKRYI